MELDWFIARTSSLGHDAEQDGPRSRAIELAKVDRLPSAENELTILDEDALRRAEERGQDVRRRVALGVQVVVLERDGFQKLLDHVLADVGLSVRAGGECGRHGGERDAA